MGRSFVSKKCCLGLIPIILGLLALMCCILFSYWCESIQFPLSAESNSLEDLDISDDIQADIRLGPWYRKGTELVQVTSNEGTDVSIKNVCVDLPDETELDGAWKAVRAFTIIIPILGGHLIFIIALANFCTNLLSGRSWKAIAIIFCVVLTTLQGLTFLLFASNACSTNPLIYEVPPDTIRSILWEQIVNAIYESDCRWGPGSTANVFAVLGWFLTGLSMLVLGEPQG